MLHSDPEPVRTLELSGDGQSNQGRRIEHCLTSAAQSYHNPAPSYADEPARIAGSSSDIPVSHDLVCGYTKRPGAYPVGDHGNVAI